jgi:hypothetical protein
MTDPGDRAADPVQQLKAWLQVASEVLDEGAELTGLAEHVRRTPYVTLGAALGVGYVAGGGLLSATSRRLLGLGLKLAAVPIVQEKLLDVVEAALDAVLASTPRANAPAPSAGPPADEGPIDPS